MDLFTSPFLLGISTSVIGSVIVEGGKYVLTELTRKTFEEKYERALNISLKDSTKKKQVKELFQSSTLNDKVYAFRERGQIIEDQFLIDLFKPVLGKSADIFVRDFITNVRKEIAKDQKLSNEITQLYLEILMKSTEFLKTQLAAHDKTTQQNHAQIISLLEHIINGQTNTSDILESAGFREILPLPKIFVQPKTSLEKVEIAFQENAVCYLWGLPGSGKSVIASAYAHSQKGKKSLFWLEFRPRQSDSKLVEQDILH